MEKEQLPHIRHKAPQSGDDSRGPPVSALRSSHTNTWSAAQWETDNLLPLRQAKEGGTAGSRENAILIERELQLLGLSTT
jgi:hypothetical protein